MAAGGASNCPYRVKWPAPTQHLTLLGMHAVQPTTIRSACKLSALAVERQRAVLPRLRRAPLRPQGLTLTAAQATCCSWQLKPSMVLRCSQLSPQSPGAQWQPPHRPQWQPHAAGRHSSGPAAPQPPAAAAAGALILQRQGPGQPAAAAARQHALPPGLPPAAKLSAHHCNGNRRAHAAEYMLTWLLPAHSAQG